MTNARTTKRAAVVVMGAVMMGCAGQPAAPQVASAPEVERQEPGTLLALLANANTPMESRKSADRVLAGQEGKTFPPRLAVLEQLLYEEGQTDEMRVYALDELVEADPARAGAAIALYLPRMKGAVLAHACAAAVKLGDERVVGSLIRSMARGVRMEAGDAERLRARPEWKAIETLSGKSGVEALYGAVAGSRDRSVRIAALDCVQRVDSAEAVRQRIGAMSGEEGWPRDVKWWVGMFGVPPVGEAEAAEVEYLHRPEQGALVARAAEREKTVAGEADFVMAPRYVAVLAYVPERELGMSRAALLEELKAVVNPEVEGKLSRGDLLVLAMLRGGLQGGALVGTLQQQGLEDLSDTSAAHGGLLVLRNIDAPRIEAMVYPMGETGDDQHYVPSDTLVQRAGTGLAVYHFAFQQVRNEAMAKPTAEELERVRLGRWNAVKVTSVETHKMRVVFYTPAGAVVDLETAEVR